MTMKKVFTFILCCVILFSVSYAEDVDVLIAQWNSYSKTYLAPELSKDMIVKDAFVGKNWKLLFDGNGDTYKGAVVYATTNMETFISLCIQTGVIVVGNYKYGELRDFIGDLVYMYYTAKTGGTNLASVFGYYTFIVEKKNNAYYFTIMGL